jgi:Domain of unknown function (DUF4386)
MNGSDSREWLVPLGTMIAFVVLLIVSFIVSGTPKEADDGPAEVAEWYSDNKDSAQIGAFIGVVAAIPLLFFGGYLRKVLEPAGGFLSTLPLIGLTIVAVGAAIDNMLLFAAAEAADDITGPQLQTIQALWDNDFLPILMGIMVFLWSVGIAVLRSDVLPKWLGWFALVFAVIALAGPLGFISFPGALLWVIVAGIVLTMRARPTATPAAPGGPAA